MYFAHGAEGENCGSNALRAFLVFTSPSGRGLVIPIFFVVFYYPAIRTGSSNTHFFYFLGGHLPQTSGFRSARHIIVSSLHRLGLVS